MDPLKRNVQITQIVHLRWPVFKDDASVLAVVYYVDQMLTVNPRIMLHGVGAVLVSSKVPMENAYHVS